MNPRGSIAPNQAIRARCFDPENFGSGKKNDLSDSPAASRDGGNQEKVGGC